MRYGDVGRLEAISSVEASAAVLFREVHGLVGQAHQVSAQDGVSGKRGDACAHAERHGPLIVLKRRFLKGRQDSLGYSLRFREVCVPADEDELIAAVPDDLVVCSDGCLQHFAQVHERRIACIVAQAVIDALEAVNVDEYH